ncbi:MAG: xseA, partial [Chlamydiales bacterium]|nr:xseA [Chlamydiales bacterium]
MSAFIPKGPNLESAQRGPQGEPNAFVLSVSQLTQAIKLQLENAFPHIVLQGEVSNFKAQSSGHWYFSLKDAGAQISAVMFRQEASRVTSAI